MAAIPFAHLLGTKFFGNHAVPDPANGTMLLDRLSTYLPWRMYDSDTDLFYNRDSIGFIIEIAPLVGADDTTIDTLGKFLTDSVPDGTSMQFLSWSSPRVSRKLKDWFAPRYAAGGIYARLARHRTEKFFNGVWDSMSEDAPFHLRHYRTIISVGFPGAEHDAERVRALIALRDGLVGLLKSIQVGSIEVDAQQLIALVDDLTSPTTCAADDEIEYNPHDVISEQVIRRDVGFKVMVDRMELTTERFRPTGVLDKGVAEIGELYPDKFDLRHFAVRNYPKYWSGGQMGRLIGDFYSKQLRYPCPVATVLCIEFPKVEKEASRASLKFLRGQSLADSQASKFSPGLKQTAADWKFVQERLEAGSRILKVFYGLTMYSPYGRGDDYEKVLKSIYRSAGWDIVDEKFVQLQGLLATLPLTLADGLNKDMEKMGRFKRMLSTTVADIAPIQGEYLGNHNMPHMLLTGRRGQPFYWSPFENDGNHNCAIIGSSGSGKSMFIQDLACSLSSTGAMVTVIDDGRSFESSSKLQNADFIEFTLAQSVCLNPFSIIDFARAHEDPDYKLECMMLLRSMIGQMARTVDKLDDLERGIIDEVVNDVWDTHGNAGSVSRVIEVLEQRPDERSRELAQSLKIYGVTGSYGAFFDGDASIEFNSIFTVFEMGELSNKPDLRAVILVAVMFMMWTRMRFEKRSINKILIIDEAWQLLSGGSIAEFIEMFARTIRKYGGALITATQSLTDYYKNPGATAALQNSDWTLFLRQKPEALAAIRKEEFLKINESTEMMIRSLQMVEHEYSEVFIKNQDHMFIGRLVLDDFSTTLYSSTAATFEQIQLLTADGLSLEDAIEALAKKTKSRKKQSNVQELMRRESAHVRHGNVAA